MSDRTWPIPGAHSETAATASCVYRAHAAPPDSPLDLAIAQDRTYHRSLVRVVKKR